MDRLRSNAKAARNINGVLHIYLGPSTELCNNEIDWMEQAKTQAGALQVHRSALAIAGM